MDQRKCEKLSNYLYMSDVHGTPIPQQQQGPGNISRCVDGCLVAWLGIFQGIANIRLCAFESFLILKKNFNRVRTVNAENAESEGHISIDK